MSKINTYFIAGHARLPQGMAAKSVFDTLTITVEIDGKYGVIVEASCTLATEHGRDYVGKLLRGLSLREGIEEPVRIFQKHYLGRASNALTAALKDVYTQYNQFEHAKKTKGDSPIVTS
jgi:hypothetical protein